MLPSCFGDACQKKPSGGGAGRGGGASSSSDSISSSSGSIGAGQSSSGVGLLFLSASRPTTPAIASKSSRSSGGAVATATSIALMRLRSTGTRWRGACAGFSAWDVSRIGGHVWRGARRELRAFCICRERRRGFARPAGGHNFCNGVCVRHSSVCSEDSFRYRIEAHLCVGICQI